MNYFTGRFIWLGGFRDVFSKKRDRQPKSGMLLTMAVAAILMTGAAANARVSEKASEVSLAEYSGYSNGMGADGLGTATFIPDRGFSSLYPTEIDIAIDGPVLQGDCVILYWTASYSDGTSATSGCTMFLTADQMSAAGGNMAFEVFPFAYWQAAVTSKKQMKSFTVQAAGAPGATVIVAMHGMEYR